MGVRGIPVSPALEGDVLPHGHQASRAQEAGWLERENVDREALRICVSIYMHACAYLAHGYS